MKMLFVCGKNKLRSPTAEIIFSKYEGIETRSVGVRKDAEVIAGIEDIEWADIIYFMEQKHKRKLSEKFANALKTKKVVILEIKDKFGFMDKALITILKKKISEYTNGKIFDH